MRPVINITRIIGLACLALMASQASHGDEKARPAPMISIIIDDMGYRLSDGLQALNLPGPVTYSFLPYTPNLERLTDIAHSQDREILVHLPMEAQSHNRLLGPGALRASMDYDEFHATVLRSINSVPHAIGINNHMGSLLTANNKHMQWLMQTVKQDGSKFFVDSRTTAQTVAGQVAHDHGVPTITRDVFLDHEPHEGFIRQQLKKLVQKARQNGTAVAIGHPLPETIRVLKEMLPQLKQQGIQLVKLTQLMNRREQDQRKWRVSSSR